MLTLNLLLVLYLFSVKNFVVNSYSFLLLDGLRYVRCFGQRRENLLFKVIWREETDNSARYYVGQINQQSAELKHLEVESEKLIFSSRDIITGAEWLDRRFKSRTISLFPRFSNLNSNVEPLGPLPKAIGKILSGEITCPQENLWSRVKGISDIFNSWSSKSDTWKQKQNSEHLKKAQYSFVWCLQVASFRRLKSHIWLTAEYLWCTQTDSAVRTSLSRWRFYPLISAHLCWHLSAFPESLRWPSTASPYWPNHRPKPQRLLDTFRQRTSTFSQASSSYSKPRLWTNWSFLISPQLEICRSSSLLSYFVYLVLL